MMISLDVWYPFFFFCPYGGGLRGAVGGGLAGGLDAWMASFPGTWRQEEEAGQEGSVELCSHARKLREAGE